MHVYHVGIREVHINHVMVVSETELSREEILERAEHAQGGFLDLEYSHNLHKIYWSVDGISPNLDDQELK